MSEIIQKNDLFGKKAAIVGCGGLGCNIAVHLAGSNVGKIYLVDFDTVDKSNLNRQFLYTENDIGKPKVILAKQRLQAFNSQITFIDINKKIETEVDMKFANECDIIFLAVDNNKTRKIVSNFCRESNIAMVNGGINGFFGTAYTYIPDFTPCPECAGIFEFQNSTLNSVSSSAGIIGSLEAELGIKYLLDQETESAGQLYIYDNSVIEKIKIKRNANCIICSQKERLSL